MLDIPLETLRTRRKRGDFELVSERVGSRWYIDPVAAAIWGDGRNPYMPKYNLPRIQAVLEAERELLGRLLEGRAKREDKA